MSMYFKFLIIFALYLVFSYLMGVKDVKAFKRDVGAFIVISLILLAVAIVNK